ncbi:hypothetical protein [Helicobacter felis]|uniref:Uncharacterized protein n=1 Tax=Helicobacter felis (strain ATCC 49179 / CCUG 28539 / NCTC 12436 / CS1) TaxID=936155 RepID=E7AC52_HELFC|nr:hypothetical protein [Helicobacter felis]CBY82134.1 unnamed protein product [Helicobacter felis ATCC 49179]
MRLEEAINLKERIEARIAKLEKMLGRVKKLIGALTPLTPEQEKAKAEQALFEQIMQADRISPEDLKALRVKFEPFEEFEGDFSDGSITSAPFLQYFKKLPPLDQQALLSASLKGLCLQVSKEVLDFQAASLLTQLYYAPQIALLALEDQDLAHLQILSAFMGEYGEITPQIAASMGGYEELRARYAQELHAFNDTWRLSPEEVAKHLQNWLNDPSLEAQVKQEVPND